MTAKCTHFFAVFFLAASFGEVRAENIAVILSSDAAIYQEALEGFREIVRHRIVGVQTLKTNPAEWRDELKKLRSVIEPDLVFVAGTPALQIVAGEITNIPIVHTMVFNPFGVANKNLSGVGMNPSANQVISLLRELNPKHRRVGTMFDPSQSGPVLQETRSAFDKAGLHLIAREIRSAADVGGALRSLEKEIDILWLWPNELFLMDEILQRIFLFSFETKIPVLGLSERHTEMGALLSLSYGSAKDMGRQAAEVANRIFANAKAVLVPVVAARQTKLTVNLKTARKLKIDVPFSIIQRADNGIRAPVYKEGEWWVFRIKTLFPSSGRTDVEDHRVAFKNGKFETDHLSFLRGEDLAAGATFRPFPSVYLTDPESRWLDFPLIPGRQWSFRYSRRYYLGRGNLTSATATAEVIGRAAQPVRTPAGTFDAVEITRSDNLRPIATLTYYYSPQTKTVVKAMAEVDPGNPASSSRRFELELIAYGSEATAKKDSR